jgi:signal transduction histidine kinase
MNRPWHRWLVFASCLAVLLGALGWMTVTLLRFERAQTELQRQAQLEERVRLALWRMDSALTALVVEESARPASEYQRPPAAAPTPFLGLPSPGIRLRFQREPDGTLTSPQVPISATPETDAPASQPPGSGHDFRERLQAVRALLERPAATVPATVPAPGPESPAGKASILAKNWDVLMRESAVAPGPVETPDPVVGPRGAPDADQRLLNSLELQSRANVFQQATQQAAANSGRFPDPSASARDAGALVFKALWLDGELILARSALSRSGPVVQGVWLDWPHLRASLLGSIADLFPMADLRPITPNAVGDAGRRFATVPAELVPGRLADDFAGPRSPLHLSLALAWSGILLAAAAAAALLHGTLALSERRAAFVSAVTHELRTPLTTFKLYSEMLAEDMVTEPAQRKKYLATLTAEAGRLGHLVENVLAYAQLERGQARQHREHLTVRELVDRLAPRLAERAEQAGLQLAPDTTAPAADAVLEIDVAAVEQILFNLVDNACKYAGPQAADRIIHLEVLPAPGPARFATLRVRDHGPGLSKEAARRLFQPFSRSAAAAARGVPGVGLGLALSRRLSRSLGGTLSHDPDITDGAAFILRLPLGPAPE